MNVRSVRLQADLSRVRRKPDTTYVLTALLMLWAAPAFAQGVDVIDGYVSAMVDVLPDVGAAAGRQSVSELRMRVFVERRHDIGAHLHFNFAGFVDALVAERSSSGGSSSGGSTSGASKAATAAIVRPTDLYAEWRAARFDIRAGASRIVWGRLDEFQPGDVVNPIDVTRFFMEGRSEARMAVGLVRARGFLPAGVTVEGVLVPKFRRGRFDQLDEATSPFNIGAQPPAVCLATFPPRCTSSEVERREPDFGWRQMQGGARVTGTVGRLDLGGSVYRGYEPFASYALEPFPFPTFAPAPPTLVETFPRFTMVAGDFETTRGPWGIRGEAAYFPEDTLQSTEPLTPVPARTLDVGVGVDRRAGNYRIAANVIASRRSAEAFALQDDALALQGSAKALAERSEVLFVGWAERTFERETRSIRLLAAYDPAAGSAFVRGIGAVSVRDNVWLEMSAGWLTGSGTDMLSRLAQRDFVYARVKVHF